MPTSQATLILREVERGQPISARTRAFQRRRLQNRFHRFILKTFREQQRKGLTQKQLAERIDSRPEQINRWLSIPGNLTLNTISDLLLGMAVDLDDPSATPLLELAREVEQEIVPISVREAVNALPMIHPAVFVLQIPEANISQHEAPANTQHQSAASSVDAATLSYLMQKKVSDIGAFVNERSATT